MTLHTLRYHLFIADIDIGDLLILLILGMADSDIFLCYWLTDSSDNNEIDEVGVFNLLIFVVYVFTDLTVRDITDITELMI